MQLVHAGLGGDGDPELAGQLLELGANHHLQTEKYKCFISVLLYDDECWLACYLPYSTEEFLLTFPLCGALEFNMKVELLVGKTNQVAFKFQFKLVERTPKITL